MFPSPDELKLIVEQLETIHQADPDSVNRTMARLHRFMTSLNDQLSHMSTGIDQCQNLVWKLIPYLYVTETNKEGERRKSRHVEQCASLLSEFLASYSTLLRDVQQWPDNVEKSVSEGPALEHSPDDGAIENVDNVADEAENKMEAKLQSSPEIAAHETDEVYNIVMTCKEGDGCFQPKGWYRYSGAPCTHCGEWVHRVCSAKRSSSTDLCCTSCYTKHYMSNYHMEIGSKKWQKEKDFVENLVPKTVDVPVGLLKFDPRDPATHICAQANVKFFEIREKFPNDFC